MLQHAARHGLDVGQLALPRALEFWERVFRFRRNSFS